MIVEMIEGSSFVSNCYIVGSEKSGIGMVVDPSTRLRNILRATRRLELSISIVVVTHTHPDHVGSLTQVVEATEAEFLVHEREETSGLMQSLGRVVGMFQGGDLRRLPRPDRILRDGDVIKIGELEFSVIYTPGHTAGGICLYGHGILFSGDTLFYQGVGRTDMPGMSHSRLMNSIVKTLMSLPDETKVYPGHGPSTTIGWERNYNPFVREWLRSGR